MKTVVWARKSRKKQRRVGVFKCRGQGSFCSLDVVVFGIFCSWIFIYLLIISDFEDCSKWSIVIFEETSKYRIECDEHRKRKLLIEWVVLFMSERVKKKKKKKKLWLWAQWVNQTNYFSNCALTSQSSKIYLEYLTLRDSLWILFTLKNILYS